MTVTDRLMKEYLLVMPRDGDFSTIMLAHKLEGNYNNVRRVLLVMEELGMVKREDTGNGRYVWKRLVTL